MAAEVALHQTAPGFELSDFEGNARRLSDYLGRKHVLLVFNRGFT